MHLHFELCAEQEATVPEPVRRADAQHVRHIPARGGVQDERVRARDERHLGGALHVDVDLRAIGEGERQSRDRPVAEAGEDPRDAETFDRLLCGAERTAPIGIPIRQILRRHHALPPPRHPQRDAEREVGEKRHLHGDRQLRDEERDVLIDRRVESPGVVGLLALTAREPLLVGQTAHVLVAAAEAGREIRPQPYRHALVDSRRATQEHEGGVDEPALLLGSCASEGRPKVHQNGGKDQGDRELADFGELRRVVVDGRRVVDGRDRQAAHGRHPRVVGRRRFRVRTRDRGAQHKHQRQESEPRHQGPMLGAPVRPASVPL